MLTKNILIEKILAFLTRELTADELTVWAEYSILEGDYEESYFDVISDSLHRRLNESEEF